MFAYCANNPILYVDSTGHMYVGLLNGNPETVPDMGGGGYAHIPSVPITPDSKENVWNNIKDDVVDFAVLGGVAIGLLGFASTVGWIFLPKAVEVAFSAIGLTSTIYSAVEHFMNR